MRTIESVVNISIHLKISWKLPKDYKSWNWSRRNLENCPSQKLSSQTVSLLKTSQFLGDCVRIQELTKRFPLFHLLKLTSEIVFWEILSLKTLPKSCLQEVTPSREILTSLLYLWNSKYNSKFYKIKTREKLFFLKALAQQSTGMETCSAPEWELSLKVSNMNGPFKESKDKNSWQTNPIISEHWRTLLKDKDAQSRMLKLPYQFCQEYTRRYRFIRSYNRNNHTLVKSTTRKLCMNFLSTTHTWARDASNQKIQTHSL